MRLLVGAITVRSGRRDKNNANSSTAETAAQDKPKDQEWTWDSDDFRAVWEAVGGVPEVGGGTPGPGGAATLKLAHWRLNLAGQPVAATSVA